MSNGSRTGNARRKLKVRAAYGLPLSSGGVVPAILIGKNVIFGGCALALIDEQRTSPEDDSGIVVSTSDQILAFLLTHPNDLEDGSWPLLTQQVTIDPLVEARLNPGKITNPIVLRVSIVLAFAESCMGLRDWDEPLNERWKPADMLFARRRRPARSRRRLNAV